MSVYFDAQTTRHCTPAVAKAIAACKRVYTEKPTVIEKVLRHLALCPALNWAKGPAPAHRPPAGYPLPYSLQRVALVAS
jgi:hypothetical protein